MSLVGLTWNALPVTTAMQVMSIAYALVLQQSYSTSQLDHDSVTCRYFGVLRCSLP